jgi:YgiT-type zinc finger domain-containing protein
VNSWDGRPMICDICGKQGAEIHYVARNYGKGANLLIIENVPVVSCPHCGESYLTAETLHEIVRIKLHRKNLAKPRNVAVAEYVRAQA